MPLLSQVWPFKSLRGVHIGIMELEAALAVHHVLKERGSLTTELYLLQLQCYPKGLRMHSRAVRMLQEHGNASVLTIDMASRRHTDNLGGRWNVERAAKGSYDISSYQRDQQGRHYGHA